MIAQQAFGRTGHTSTRLILGGAAFGRITQAETDAALETAFSFGVNHVDVAASYGEAELRLGDWINRHGKHFFLATKTGERTAVKAREQFQHSLERLKVDHVDLLQLHDLTDPQEWQIAFQPGGVLEAAIEARQQGLARFIGVTGHGLAAAAMHLRSLERFDFDSVLLPFSYLMAQNERYLSEFWSLVELCQSRNVAVQTIKSIVHRPWGECEPTRNTWYRPLEDQDAIDQNVDWVLGHTGLFLNSVADIHILPRVLDAASRFETSPTDQEMRRLVDRLEMQSLFT